MIVSVAEDGGTWWEMRPGEGECKAKSRRSRRSGLNLSPDARESPEFMLAICPIREYIINTCKYMGQQARQDEGVLHTSHVPSCGFNFCLKSSA